MKIAVSQLRKIIAEEVQHAMSEVAPRRKSAVLPARDWRAEAIEEYVKDCTLRAGMTGSSYPAKPYTTGLNLQELIRRIGRKPTPEDLEKLNAAWEEGRKKWGPKGTKRHQEDDPEAY